MVLSYFIYSSLLKRTSLFRHNDYQANSLGAQHKSRFLRSRSTIWTDGNAAPPNGNTAASTNWNENGIWRTNDDDCPRTTLPKVTKTPHRVRAIAR